MLGVQVTVLCSCSRSKPDTSPIPFLEETSGSTFARVDRNGDGKLGFEAFHSGLSEHYYFRQGLDLDGDSIVLQVELATALFELWDTDDDRRVSQDEWAGGMAIWFPDRVDSARFEDWDTDQDDSLDVIELGEGGASSGAFDAYDTDQDGTTSAREVSRYLFDRWDVNGDGVIEATEWLLP
jgi:hypothetical protein